MKSIMYHYVRESRADLPYFRYLHIDDFRLQLDYFEAHYRFPTKEEFLNSVRSKTVLKDAVVLTFDDGFTDHYEYVLPELEKRGMWGIFYVTTGPLASSKALNVHLIHHLLGKYGGNYMLAAIQKLLQPEMLTHAHVKEFQKLTYPDQEDDLEATTFFKRILNYYISYEWQHRILEMLLEESPCELDNIYLSPAQVKDMQERGMIIGSHSVNHQLFSKLSYAEQEREIEDSFDFLESSAGGLNVRTFCYPYGGFHSFNGDTEKILAEKECLFSFNVEYRDIETADLANRPQALPRYDCNLFPHGKAR